MFMRALFIITLAFSLSACGMVRKVLRTGGEGLEIEEAAVSDMPTKKLVKGLPDDLRGDKKNARHSRDTLRVDDSTR